jgi:hypothetical protein
VPSSPCIFLHAVFFIVGSYFEATGSYTIGTVIAHDYVTLTNAVVAGAVFSMTASVSLTVSSVRLPSTGVLALSGPVHMTMVDMLSAKSFAILGGSGIVNTVSTRHRRPQAASCLTLHCHILWVLYYDVRRVRPL